MQISSRWHKVLHDLWEYKVRTWLVILSVATAIFALGTIQHLQTVILGEMQQTYQDANAANAMIFASGMDDELVQAIRKLPNVTAAEGRNSLKINIQILSVDGQVEWKPLTLTAIPNFADIRINKLLPHDETGSTTALDNPLENKSGLQLPKDGELILERSSLTGGGLTPADLQIGDSVVVETSTNRRKTLQVVDLVYDPTTVPAALMGNAIGYVTPETMEWLGGAPGYGQLNLSFTGNTKDRENNVAIAKEVEKKIQKSGRTVFYSFVPEPEQLPLQDVFESLGEMLVPLSVIMLLLSAILVVNIISALLSQQIRQIGVMKAIGARTNQVLGMYISTVLICGLLAFLVAAPLSAVVANLIIHQLAELINISVPRFSLPPQVLITEVALAALAPLLASLYPLWKGTRITVREAMSDYGIGNQALGSTWSDRLLGQIRGISRPLLISFRNTFRRGGRLTLTLLVLILGGIIFITVSSIRLSLSNTLEDALQYWQFDIKVDFTRAYRISNIEEIAGTVPGVIDIESWGIQEARRIRTDDTESDSISISAPPADTQMINPRILAGRWLVPEDENAIVISQNVLKNEPDLEIGSRVTLLLNNQETIWRVVGVTQVIGQEQSAYINYPYFSQTLGMSRQASNVQITVAQTDTEDVLAVAQQLKAAFEEKDIHVSSVQTVLELRQQNESSFDIVASILFVISILIASIGALGLMGTMSINVLERTREVGVMRSIGATTQDILRIILSEGVVIGSVSWLVAAILAYPAGAWLSNTVGMTLFQTPLSYIFAIRGLIAWLAIVIILSIVASFLPAWNASRLTVREVLAYE
ncbi:MAG: ABC transporter permease [Chloroflexota bacterium]